MRVISPARCEVTIRRPNGVVETVVHPKQDKLNDGLMRQMRAAMSQAGQGEVLSYRNIDRVVELDEEDYRESCGRCHVTLDRRTAYVQKEWMRLGGNRVQYNAYYCPQCHGLLSAVGCGEYSDLESRAGHCPSREHPYKGDD